MKHLMIAMLMIAAVPAWSAGQEKPNANGVFPHLAMVADHTPRTESGTGGLLSWADRLWVITYVAHKRGTGAGTGLYSIDENFELKKHAESVVGTYANRMIHGPSEQAIIGPHFIDTEGNVRTAKDLVDYRLTATCKHLTDPKNKVYFVGMEGEFLEVDVQSLKVTKLFDLLDELHVPGESYPHFKSAFTMHGRVVVANNSYDQDEFAGAAPGGRLAEWDGKTWKIIDKNPYTEVAGIHQFGNPLLATGWDQASALLQCFDHKSKTWKLYRLPKGATTYDNHSATEWFRIRSVETERLLMDCHGLFYEVPLTTYEGLIIQPICRHLRIVPDYCSWRGMLVLGGNQATPMEFNTGRDADLTAGQPQTGLWFGKTDDLWQFGKPRGFGGVWRDSAVTAGNPSDPLLMFGFDRKVLHLQHDADQSVTFDVQVDILGNGRWVSYQKITAEPEGYAYHVFPPGYTAHWVRVVSDSNCSATAMFFYH